MFLSKVSAEAYEAFSQSIFFMGHDKHVEGHRWVVSFNAKTSELVLLFGARLEELNFLASYKGSADRGFDNLLKHTNLLGSSWSSYAFAHRVLNGGLASAESVKDVQFLPRYVAAALVIYSDMVKEVLNLGSSGVFIAEALVPSNGRGGFKLSTFIGRGILQRLIFNLLLAAGTLGFFGFLPFGKSSKDEVGFH